jgi:hypothetical protein
MAELPNACVLNPMDGVAAIELPSIAHFYPPSDQAGARAKEL